MALDTVKCGGVCDTLKMRAPEQRPLGQSRRAACLGSGQTQQGPPTPDAPGSPWGSGWAVSCQLSLGSPWPSWRSRLVARVTPSAGTQASRMPAARCPKFSTRALHALLGLPAPGL